jgi:hypothetical protein
MGGGGRKQSKKAENRRLRQKMGGRTRKQAEEAETSDRGRKQVFEAENGQ